MQQQSSEMRASDVLAEARSIVENGWCKGAMEKGGGASFCALGGIYQAAFGSVYATREALEGHQNRRSQLNAFCVLTDLAKEYGHPSISLYNNHPSTTHQDVLNWFDKAIAQAEEKGL